MAFTQEPPLQRGPAQSTHVATQERTPTLDSTPRSGKEWFFSDTFKDRRNMTPKDAMAADNGSESSKTFAKKPP